MAQVQFPVVQDLSLLHTGAHPTCYQMGAGDLSPGIKMQRGDSDHLPPCSTEVMKGGAIPPLPNAS
jgi:hypothetical protein